MLSRLLVNVNGLFLHKREPPEAGLTQQEQEGEGGLGKRGVEVPGPNFFDSDSGADTVQSCNRFILRLPDYPYLEQRFPVLMSRNRNTETLGSRLGIGTEL